MIDLVVMAGLGGALILGGTLMRLDRRPGALLLLAFGLLLLLGAIYRA